MGRSLGSEHVRMMDQCIPEWPGLMVMKKCWVLYDKIKQAPGRTKAFDTKRRMTKK